MLIHAVAPNRRSLTRMGDSLPQGSLDRRRFLTAVAVSTTAAVATACSNAPYKLAASSCSARQVCGSALRNIAWYCGGYPGWPNLASGVDPSDAEPYQRSAAVIARICDYD